MPKATRNQETRRRHAGRWADFSSWCAHRGVPALGCPPEAAAEYLAGLMARGRAGTARQHAAAVAWRHGEAGLASPTKSAAGRAALRPAGAGKPPRTATTPSALRAAALRCPGDLAGLRDRVILLLKAEARASNAQLACLHASHVAAGDAATTVALEGHRARTANLARLRPSEGQCAARAIEEWVSASRRTWGPLLVAVDRAGRLGTRALGATAIGRIANRRLRAGR